MRGAADAGRPEFAAAAQLLRLAGDEPARATYGHDLQELQRSTFTIDTHVARLEGSYRDAVAGRG